MAIVELAAIDFVELCDDRRVYEEHSILHGTEMVVVDFRRASLLTLETHPTLPCIVLGRVSESTPDEVRKLCDLVLDDNEFDRYGDQLKTAIARNPMAAVSLAIHLRFAEQRTIEEGLVAESTLYSLLQSGPEFAAWLGSRQPTKFRERPTEPAVICERTGNQLRITLNRAEKHNAFSTEMRDELVSALNIATCDDTITEIVLAGAGPSFCSGGDLSQFGTFASPVASHLTRLTRSPARLLATLSTITKVHLHGACYGAGIELPAFARLVSADSDTSFCLPELGLGLVPGAGGTVSLPRRVGRHRAALLGLSGTTIDTTTALKWGLIDEIRVDHLGPSGHLSPVS